MGAEPRNETVGTRVALIAGRQHGCVTRAQLDDARVSRREVEVRIRRGELLRVHRGVYRVGHRAPSVLAGYMAAVLACGTDAVLTGGAAGYLHRLLRGAAPAPEVTTPGGRRLPGVCVHRSRDLDPRDIGMARGIPVTKIPRTLVDLAGHLDLPRLSRAIHEARVLYDIGASEVDAAMSRHPRSPGVGALRRILHGDEHITMSQLERRFLAQLRSAGLPLPATNVLASGRTVDCRWPSHQLTVELDGYRFHSSRHAWERDRSRERETYARGDEFRRYTYADVLEHPHTMLRELRALLAT